MTDEVDEQKMKLETCYKECKRLASLSSVYQRVNYLMHERDDFGYYGTRILYPCNLFYISEIFRTRYLTNCFRKCQKINKEDITI